MPTVETTGSWLDTWFSSYYCIGTKKSTQASWYDYLTYAVGSTTDYKTVQGISGHADLFTLMNRYAHPQEDKVNQLSSEITKILTQNVEKC